jgi:membrane protease subunit HflK
MINKIENPWDNKNKKQEDLEKIIKKGQEKIFDFLNNKKSHKPGGGGPSGNFPPFNFDDIDLKKIIIAALLIIITLWLSTCFYTVQPDEEAVVLRFGKYNRTSIPGLNYKLPAPFETVTKISVTRVNKEEIGFRSSGKRMLSREQFLENTVSTESQMLTTDENIVDLNFEIQWIINDAQKFLFNVRDLNNENTVKASAESAMREVIGLSKVTEVLAEERSKIEHNALLLLQGILDSYNMGVKVVRIQLRRVDPPQEVIDAYRDVQNAKQDKERNINIAYSYRNDILPKARGEAEQVLQEAEGYKKQVIAEAQGEAQRFSNVYEQYRNAKEVTRKKMYLETMESILDGMNKIIIDKSSNGVVPYLPLNELKKNKKEDKAHEGQ